MKIHQCIYLFFVFFLVTLCKDVTAQDTLFTVEEGKTPDIVQYLTPMDYAFMMHEETPWMFRVSFPEYENISSLRSIIDEIGNTHFRGAQIEFERKLGTGFSLNTLVGYKSTNNIQDQFYFEVAPRFYFDQKKRVRENRSVGNLSGPYFSLGYQFNTETDRPNQHLAFGEFGMQQRFLKNGFFNFGIRAGISKYERDLLGASFFAATNTTIGLAFAKDKFDLDDAKLCEVFKCYEVEKRLFKMNVLDVFNSSYTRLFNQLNSKLALAYEEKIGRSPFSLIAHSTNIFYRTALGEGPAGVYSTLNINYRFGSRYYYNLKKRMVKGKAGNGLSANYLSWELLYDYTKYKIDRKFEGTESTDVWDGFGTQVLAGIQRSVSDHLFFDLNIGLGVAYIQKNQGANEFNMLYPINLTAGFKL